VIRGSVAETGVSEVEEVGDEAAATGDEERLTVSLCSDDCDGGAMFSPSTFVCSTVSLKTD
jgi:hypothetical protein